jgi:hypothetical protein
VRVEQGDGFGNRWAGRDAERGGLGWHRHGHPGAAEAPVAPERFAAARADEAQL